MFPTSHCGVVAGALDRPNRPAEGKWAHTKGQAQEAPQFVQNLGRHQSMVHEESSDLSPEPVQPRIIIIYNTLYSVATCDNPRNDDILFRCFSRTELKFFSFFLFFFHICDTP
ncbi:uncharacterized protein CLUP02_04092 [Colletotrichum lupini]|uniref:Uncharacterized protein n=1 Tax=Colletotrichum lupini TaxID=145971 RepID=A0A9Q8SK33_9PEZI|nr:uncharacterized protein CLUP02_04092 [Colletotrichum lupini]UQC78615.1 hypothetical protein CLUP02_04092 [Colletotrichum lupini]